MVAFDESSEASRALRASIDLAKALRAELNVVTLLEPIPGYYSFAVSAVSAWNWTEEKRVRYSALQAPWSVRGITHNWASINARNPVFLALRGHT